MIVPNEHDRYVVHGVPVDAAVVPFRWRLPGGCKYETVTAVQCDRELTRSIASERMRVPGYQVRDDIYAHQILEPGPQLASGGLAQLPDHPSLLFTELPEAIVLEAYVHRRPEFLIYQNGKDFSLLCPD